MNKRRSHKREEILNGDESCPSVVLNVVRTDYTKTAFASWLLEARFSVGCAENAVFVSASRAKIAQTSCNQSQRLIRSH